MKSYIIGVILVAASLLTENAAAQTLFVPGTIGSSSQAGKVGIGTSAPNRPLELFSDVYGLSFEAGVGSPDSGAIRFGDNSGWRFFIGRSREAVGAALNSGAAGALVTFLDNGNVGIGTVNPTAPLVVDRSFDGTTVMRIENTSATAASRAGVQLVTSGGESAYLLVNSGSYTGVSDWTDAMIMGTDSSMDGGVVVYSPDKVRIQNVPGVQTFAVTGGNVGIGTATPEAILSIESSSLSAVRIGQVSGGSARRQLVIGYDTAQNYAGIQAVDQDVAFRPLVLQASGGNVGIGTPTPAHKLAVNGTVKAKEVIVENTGWSDYVFSEDYRLAPLAEVEAHIREKKHLPGVPSASEVAMRGVSVGEMQATLLAKIEELTLHVIRQEKTMAAAHSLIESQQREIEALKGQLSQLNSAK